MAGLVVGGVTIPVAPGSGSWDWNDAVDRRRAFDNTYRASSTGGAARDGQWTTPPVTRVNAGIYRGVLQQVAAQMCSGDLIEIPTMCCAELINESPVKQSNGSLVVMQFALHEVQGKKLLLKYTPGDTISGESFTGPAGRFYFSGGALVLPAALNVKRDQHHIGGVRTLFLEGPSQNGLLWSNDFSNAAWIKNTMTVTTGIADPGGGTTACTLTATGASADAHQNLSAGSSIPRINSVWMRRRTGTGLVRLFAPDNATAASPALTAAWQRVLSPSAASTVRDFNITISASGDAVDVWIGQLEDGPTASSEIITTIVAVTRAAEFYSLPFPYPPMEMTVYAKFFLLGSVANNYLFDIANAADAAEKFLVYRPSNYAASHGVDSLLSTGPAIGDVVELSARLFGDGSVDASQSINSGAVTSSTQSVASALGTAFSGQLVWLNSGGTLGNNGFVAIQSFKIVAGARSLVEMRVA